MDVKKIENAFSKSNKRLRISPKVEAMLNEQISVEYTAAYLYKHMATWANYTGYKGAACYMTQHYEEELEHADRLYCYMLDRGAMPKTPTIKAPSIALKSLKELFNAALDHEIKVTESYIKACDIAMSDKDKVTAEFLRDYISEQRDEEGQFIDILDRLDLIGTDKPEYFLDLELAKKEE